MSVILVSGINLYWTMVRQDASVGIIGPQSPELQSKLQYAESLKWSFIINDHVSEHPPRPVPATFFTHEFFTF
jgi:hypothetical protein